MIVIYWEIGINLHHEVSLINGVRALFDRFGHIVTDQQNCRP